MEALPLSDGSRLTYISAKNLICIPIWHGNRILDELHLSNLRRDLCESKKGLDLSLYRIVSYPVQEDPTKPAERTTVIVDGQHRSKLLREYYAANPDAPDIGVLVVEKECASEAEVIEYFKLINNIKPIEWREDPRVAANPYVSAIEKVFNTKSQKFIRQGITKRPYLSVDALREELIRRRIGIGMATEMTPDAFAAAARDWNRLKLDGIRSDSNMNATTARAVKLGFVLAMDTRWSWIDDILRT